VLTDPRFCDDPVRRLELTAKALPRAPSNLGAVASGRSPANTNLSVEFARAANAASAVPAKLPRGVPAHQQAIASSSAADRAPVESPAPAQCPPMHVKVEGVGALLQAGTPPVDPSAAKDPPEPSLGADHNQGAATGERGLPSREAHGTAPGAEGAWAVGRCADKRRPARFADKRPPASLVGGLDGQSGGDDEASSADQHPFTGTSPDFDSQSPAVEGGYLKS